MHVTIPCMKLRIALTLMVLALPASAESPIAEVICAPREQMVERLTVQYRAHLSGMGMRDRDMVMEIWADAEGRWTLVQRYANGQSCILAMGAEWTALDDAG
jgi:hypothetical protein